MRFEDAAKVLKGIPHTGTGTGRKFYDWVLEQRPQQILELGFAHGVSTCYMAAALDELGDGRIVSMDLVGAKNRDPNIETLAGRLGLERYIEPVYAERSFTWELRRLLDSDPQPRFDFVFQDGGHTWDVAGYAFFLADRLLKPGGWMLFDDLTWTLADSRGVSGKKWVAALPEDERTAAQVGDVFRLLVETHPGYVDQHKTRDGTWGWARKR